MDIVIAHIVLGVVVIAFLIAMLKTVDWEACWIIFLVIAAITTLVGVANIIDWSIDALVAFYGG